MTNLPGDEEDEETDERIETLTFNLKDLFKPSDLVDKQLLSALQEEEGSVATPMSAPEPAPPTPQKSESSAPAAVQPVRQYYDNGAVKSETIYDEDGVPESETVFGADGVTLICEVIYTGGLPAYANSYAEDGSLEKTTFYAADGKTRLSEEIFGPGEELQSRTDYYEDGTSVQIREERHGERRITCEFFRSGEAKSKLIEQGELKVWESQMDEKGVLLLLFDGFSTTTYERDAAGGLVGSVSKWSDGTTHWYDAVGNEIRHEK